LLPKKDGTKTMEDDDGDSGRSHPEAKRKGKARKVARTRKVLESRESFFRTRDLHPNCLQLPSLLRRLVLVRMNIDGTKECLLMERGSEPVKGVWWWPGGRNHRVMRRRS
jgi:hypothetical protein